MPAPSYPPPLVPDTGKVAPADGKVCPETDHGSVSMAESHESPELCVAESAVPQRAHLVEVGQSGGLRGQSYRGRSIVPSASMPSLNRRRGDEGVARTKAAARVSRPLPPPPPRLPSGSTSTLANPLPSLPGLPSSSTTSSLAKPKALLKKVSMVFRRPKTPTVPPHGPSGALAATPPLEANKRENFSFRRKVRELLGGGSVQDEAGSSSDRRVCSDPARSRLSTIKSASEDPSPPLDTHNAFPPTDEAGPDETEPALPRPSRGRAFEAASRNNPFTIPRHLRPTVFETPDGEPIFTGLSPPPARVLPTRRTTNHPPAPSTSQTEQPLPTSSLSPHRASSAASDLALLPRGADPFKAEGVWSSDPDALLPSGPLAYYYPTPSRCDWSGRGDDFYPADVPHAAASA